MNIQQFINQIIGIAILAVVGYILILALWIFWNAGEKRIVRWISDKHNERHQKKNSEGHQKK